MGGKSRTLYKRKCPLPLHGDEGEFPVFGKVTGIYIVGSSDVVFDVAIHVLSMLCLYQCAFSAMTIFDLDHPMYHPMYHP